MIGRAARCRCRTGARSSPTTRACGPSRGCPRSASTSPTTRSRSGRRPRRRRAPAAPRSRSGRSPGPAAWRWPTTSRSAPTRSGRGPSSTSRPAAGSSRSRRCEPARRACVAADIDPFAEAAAGLNARANGVRYEFVSRDLLLEEPPDVEVLLAADTWYEGPLAERVRPWLQAAADRGDPRPRRRPGPALPARRLARGARRVRGRDDDPARGPRRGDQPRVRRATWPVTSTPFTRSLGGRSPRTNASLTRRTARVSFPDRRRARRRGRRPAGRDARRWPQRRLDQRPRRRARQPHAHRQLSRCSVPGSSFWRSSGRRPSAGASCGRAS